MNFYIRLIILCAITLFLGHNMGIKGFLIGVGITIYKVLNSIGLIRSINISKLSFTGGLIYYKEYTGSYKKTGQNFSELSEELRNTENKISFSRQFYNDTVTRYNTKIQVFPSNIIAGMFNFTARELFKAESDEARKNVKVDFGNN